MALRSLDLSKCILLRFLPDTLCDCASLSQLLLTGCVALEALPGRLGELPKLLSLAVERCSKLTELPPSIIDAPCLQNLILASTITQLPAGFDQLVGLLQHLDLQGGGGHYLRQLAGIPA